MKRFLFIAAVLVSAALLPARPARAQASVLHRSAIVAVDKLATPAQPVLLAVTESGSTLANVAYNVTVSAGNTWGNTLPATTAAVTPTALQAVRVTIAQITGATVYDVFLSTAANPLWVGRITEAQRAAGGFIISTVGTVTAGGGAAAGQVDVGIVGTGLASNVAPFAANNAYKPASVTAINCAGYSKAHVLVSVAVTDLRSIPTVSLLPFYANQTAAANWHQGTAVTPTLLVATANSLQTAFDLDVGSSTGLVILVDSIAGQGTAVSIWVELRNPS